MEGVYVCENAPCAKPAVAFGMREAIKCRSCEEHLKSCLSKGLQIYDIAGYSFITSHNDVQLFEKRKTLATKGRGNLTVLETSCESEKNEALQAIDAAKKNVVQAVEDRFEEMKAVVAGILQEAKSQFAKLQFDLEQFLIAKENQLSPLAALLCGDMSVVPRFLRFGIADVSDRVSTILSDSWMVSTTDVLSTLKYFDANQKQAVIDSALDEALQYAAKGIQEALWHADLLIGETSITETQVQVISKLLSWEKERIEGNLKWLQHSWDLRQRYEFPASVTVRVGRTLANLLYRQRLQFSDAEKVLRYCLDIVNAQDPLSEDAMSLSAEICGVYAASTQFQQLESMGKWALQVFEASEHPPELYWTIILYMVHSMHEPGKASEVAAIVQYWGKGRVGNRLSEMLKLTTFGMNWISSGDHLKAEESLLQARHIGISHFPTSIFTAIALASLARECSSREMEQLYQQAQSIYEVTAPKSIYAAIDLLMMGRQLSNAKQYSEAEQCLRQAQSIFAVISPNSFEAAINLNNLGVLFYQTDRLRKSEECLRQARFIFARTGLKSMNEAINLSNLGLLFHDIQRWSDAEECLREAQSMFEVVAPESFNAAINLSNMGLLFFNMQRWREAEECYLQAVSFEKFSNSQSTDAAGSFYHLGMMYKAMGQSEQAILSFRKALLIFTQIGNENMKSATEGLIAELTSR